MRALCFATALLFFTHAASAQNNQFGNGSNSPRLYSSSGQFLGNVNTNRFDPDSISNPYGRYGNPYSPDSVNNQFGRYGNPYSPESVHNPYGH